jgi:hypothetical protein
VDHLTDEQVYIEAKTGWKSGGEETPCGLGATMRYSENIRQWLPKIAHKYDIRSLNDAGAGDMNWIQHVEWDVDYRPFDLYPRRKGVVQFDITKATLPTADAILCRFVLNHLGQKRADEAIRRFRNSGARWLIATQFDRGDRPFHRITLPGEPLERVPDGHEDKCYIGIWRL